MKLIGKKKKLIDISGFSTQKKKNLNNGWPSGSGF